jgi:DNA polymerase-3 subunit beta
MKLHCHRLSLQAAFHVVSGIVPTRSPKEILTNTKLQVVDGQAVLIGTDQEIGIRYELPGVEAEADGETLLPTARVASILRELQGDAVDIEVDGDAVWVRSKHSEFRLSGKDAAEFPDVPGFKDKAYHVVAAKSLREMIRRTAFATDTESTRYALGGILVEFGDNVATLAATDSRRLAVTQAACEKIGDPVSGGSTPVIPTKAMSLAERSLTDDDGDVFLALHANDALIRSPRFTIYSRLVEGRFPRYKDVIPRDAEIQLDLVVGPFQAAVRQAQIVTNEESRGVDFTFTAGTLTLNSQAADVGQSRVELPISYDGPELTITFDPRFVAEFLRVLEPESQMRLELTDSESAAVLKFGDDYTYVIMPLARDRS